MAVRMRSARAHAADFSLTSALTAEEDEDEEPAVVDGAVRRLRCLCCSARPMTLMPRRSLLAVATASLIYVLLEPALSRANAIPALIVPRGQTTKGATVYLAKFAVENGKSELLHLASNHGSTEAHV